MMNRKALIGVGVLAGLAQVVAGVVMYLASVYFARWSMFVNLFLLLICIVVGIKWYAAKYLNGKISYSQALSVGVAISISTGLIYALYNLISITWFYPNFLDDVARARMAQVMIPDTASFAARRAELSALGIAVPNLIRLSVFGSILSLLTSLFLRQRTAKPNRC